MLYHYKYVYIPRPKISCLRLSQQHDHSKKQLLAVTKTEPASKSLFVRISNTKSATKRCRRRSRAPPSLTAKRAAWTDRTGTGCLPRRLAGPSSSSRKSIIFMKYWRRHFKKPEQVEGKKKLLVYTHIANCRKIGKIYYTIYLLSNEFVVLCVYFLLLRLVGVWNIRSSHEDRQTVRHELIWRSFTVLLWTFPGFIDCTSKKINLGRE